MKEEKEVRAIYEELLADRIKLTNLLMRAFDRNAKHKKVNKYLAEINAQIRIVEDILGIELPF